MKTKLSKEEIEKLENCRTVIQKKLAEAEVSYQEALSILEASDDYNSPDSHRGFLSDYLYGEYDLDHLIKHLNIKIIDESKNS